MYTSNKLPPELKAIKRKLGLSLIKFEDANIELDPFVRAHPFETAQLIMESIIKHYKVGYYNNYYLSTILILIFIHIVTGRAEISSS